MSYSFNFPTWKLNFVVNVCMKKTKIYCKHKISYVGGGTSGGIKERIKKSLHYVIILKSYSFSTLRDYLYIFYPQLSLSIESNTKTIWTFVFKGVENCMIMTIVHALLVLHKCSWFIISKATHYTTNSI